MGSKITRPNKDFPIFGGASQADELKIFGTETESTDITLLLTNVNATEGWASGVDANGFPALSWFNAIGHTLSYITAYYLQNGIPEWVVLQEYFIGSKAVASDGFTYVSKTNNNIGNTPVGDSTNWRLAFLDSANTVVYTPTADYHPATKKYVDDTPPTVASTAEAQAQTDNTKVITPLRLSEALQGANQSLTVAGYQKLPGGLILQWGTYNATLASESFTFPIAFPTSLLNINALTNAAATDTGGAGLATSLREGTEGLTGFQLSISAIGTVGYWSAIGY